MNSTLTSSVSKPAQTTPLEQPRVVVTGVTSQIGHFLLPGLANAGFAVHAVSRKSVQRESGPSGTTWICCDIAQGMPALKQETPLLIHLAPLWLLPEIIAPLAAHGLKRVVAFSSTSIFTKQYSTNAKEIALVDRLRNAEEVLSRACDRYGVTWTIFRPTLIYGCGLDRNVATINRFIGRFGFLPIVRSASGLRQPVHAADLAQACLDVLDNAATFNKAYNLVGGQTLTYREMVEAIFRSVGRPVRFLALPEGLFRFAIRCANVLPRFRDLTPEMASRVNDDLCFSSADASADFGYAPRPFCPEARPVSPSSTPR